MSKKIKSETIYRLNHLPGEEINIDQEFDIKQSYREFDESGNLILEMAFNQYGDMADKTEYRYDEAGRIIETLIYSEDDEILERRETVSDKDGLLVKELIHYLDGSVDTHEYLYDDKGNVTGMRVTDDEDELEFSEKYYYQDNRLVKVERLNEKDKVVFRQEDIYENGVITTHKIWSIEEGEPFTLIHHFNALGHRELELRYNSRDQLIERNIYEEDEHGRLIRIIEENKQRKNTTDFSYDEQGNVIQQVETDLSGDRNHEVFRFYNPEGELIQATVETVMKSSGSVLAYSLIYKRETF